MRFACSLILELSLATAAAFSQDGALLYKQRCAACHEAPQGRVPAIGTIKQMTGEAIYGVLTNGVMKPQAEGLATAELIKLIVYVAPTGGASTKTAKEPAPRAHSSRSTRGRTGAAGARTSPTRGFKVGELQDCKGPTFPNSI